MNKFCFGAIYNGRLWKKELGVSAQYKSAIYTAAVRFSRRKVYIHGCRLSSIKALFTQQPFPMQNVLYTLLPCLQYEMDIYTAVIPKAKNIANKKCTHSMFSQDEANLLISCVTL